MENKILTAERINNYLLHLKEEERSAATLQKYRHDLNALAAWLAGAPLTKSALLAWKEALTARYAPVSVNSMLTAVNGILSFLGWESLKVRLLKIQKAVFCDESRELTRAEYARLVAAARREGSERLSLVIQTICATGIRVSELRFITVEAVQSGRAEVCNKGKRRIVFLPEKLRRLLKQYVQKQKRTAGAVFVTRTGKPLDRSNLWRDMKALCESAGVAPGKVFPHNLRHKSVPVFADKDKRCVL